MDSHHWILIILTLGFTLFTVWVIYISSRKRVDPPLPPGPIGMPVVGSLPFLGPELHTYFTELSEKYGPLFSIRLGQKMGVVVSSPSAAKQVLKEFDVIFANHAVPIAGREATYGGLDLLWRPYGPEWRMLRKVCIREMLGSTTLNAVYILRKREIQETMRTLTNHASLVDIGEQMFITSMNVITSTLWGATAKNEGSARMGADFRSVVTDMTVLLGAPNLSDFFPSLERFDLQSIGKKMRECVKRLDYIFEGVIDQRRKMEKVDVGNDFLQVLMDLKDSSGGTFSTTDLKALLMDMVVAGTDTTSNTIEFAMAEMMNNPQVMRRAKQELDTILGESNGPLEESHALRLPYLQAIMKETLRLHPILPLLVPHSPSKSCIVGSYTIPKNSRIFLNVWAIHRDPSLWNDPLEFKPERFIDGGHDFNGNDFSYFPFGSGRRICAGIAMAERMVLYSLASLLHYYDWELPQGVEKVDISAKFGITLKKRTPLLLVASPNLSNLGKMDSL